LLFAIGKLLNDDPYTKQLTQEQKLACLSQRLPIEFNSTTYTSQTAEMKQVEGHLRVCLKVDANFESMVTVSPSEPLLSEAAYAVMDRESFNPVQAFRSILEGFAVHKGDRGEFLVLLLLTLARDKAVGHPGINGHPDCRFFKFVPFLYGKLFKPLAALTMLERDFPDAMMHFNHVVKLHDFKSIDKESLLFLMTRGAGVLCANNQQSIDTVNIFLTSGTKLDIDNIGIMLCQIKNNSDYTDKCQPELFDSMDPYHLKILKQKDKPVPIIKIVFALAAKTASLQVIRRKPSSEYNAVVYEIWSSGLSAEFLAPITVEQTTIWEGLLQASYGWKDIYKAETERKRRLRRSMYPGAADDEGHWTQWTSKEANSPPE
jgi:hypothetical protein